MRVMGYEKYWNQGIFEHKKEHGFIQLTIA